MDYMEYWTRGYNEGRIIGRREVLFEILEDLIPAIKRKGMERAEALGSAVSTLHYFPENDVRDAFENVWGKENL